ncbi:MAG: helix-turn-helix domain-containing protein [Desulfobacteraceae bacterium]|nr:helix-turn-helix domain-containing protein [Desulfobacteraceae bacterium]
MNDNLLSVGELAQSLNVPKSWVYSRTRETGANVIPRLKVGKYVRFRLNDVMEWLEGQNNNEE